MGEKGSQDQPEQGELHGRADRGGDELPADPQLHPGARCRKNEDERRGYLSWAMPQYVGGRSGDYAHLARVKEWSTGAAGGEDA